MKTILCAVVSMAVFVSPSFAAESKIQSVTVFADRAEVTRRMELTLEPGAQRVSFEGLPASLFDDSAKVSGEGQAQASLLGIRVENFRHEESPRRTSAAWSRTSGNWRIPFPI
jgi:hypothetical protein